MNSTRKTPILVNGRSVGYVQDGTYYRVITSAAQYLQKPRAIAYAVESLNAAAAARVQNFHVTDTTTDIIYTATMTDFMQNSIDVQRGGYGPQKALPLDRWDVSGGKVAHQVEKSKRGKRIPAAGEDPAYTAALELPPMQLTFDIFRNIPR